MRAIIICLLIVWIPFWFFSNTYVNDVNSELNPVRKIAINIPMWTPVKRVWQMLKEKWIIMREWTFFLYLKLNDLEWKMQAWDYVLNVPISLTSLVSQLQNSKQTETRFIIPEWFTIDDIDALLTKKWLIEAWKFNQCAKECKFPAYGFFYDGDVEWYLFPDTYFVPVANFSSEKFIKRMLDNFQRRILTDEFKAQYKAQWKTLKEIVIMASIVEREERNTSNMPTIAWVLWKRLAEGIALGADATTRYYKKSKQWVLTRADFQEDNPYNTRIKQGLPPTAISNPWYDALQASVDPKVSEYYYYLHDNDGQVHYSKTNDEHNQKKYKYLR